jgi:protein gp37
LSLNSHIEWTDATWNPVRGCTKISPGCKHCYAETFAERFRGVKPLLWRSPKLVFVNSMSDLFQDGVPDDYIEAVCRVMTKANWHTFQVLTKRSERLKNLLNGRLNFAAKQEHIWWGASVEDREYGLPRIADLQKTHASVRFLSIEPLLEDLGEFDLSGIHWAIVGGESGPGARPMKERWVLSIRDLCRDARVPFFFKQWGGVRKKQNGRLLEGGTYDEYPRRVTAPVPDKENCLAYVREAMNLSRRFVPASSLLQATV